MGIDDIKDDQKRWFAKGFMKLWLASPDASNYDGHYADFAKNFDKYVHKSTLSNLFTGKEGSSFPGKKAQNALAGYFNKSWLEVILIGYQSERGQEQVLKLKQGHISSNKFVSREEIFHEACETGPAPETSDHKISSLLQKTCEILASNTYYATALTSDIEAFYMGLQDAIDLKNVKRRKQDTPGGIPPDGDRRKKVG